MLVALAQLLRGCEADDRGSWREDWGAGLVLEVPEAAVRACSYQQQATALTLSLCALETASMCLVSFIYSDSNRKMSVFGIVHLLKYIFRD